MLRMIVRTVDTGAAANVGGPVSVTWRTLDVHAPELEALLRDEGGYRSRELVGVDLLPDPAT